MASRLTTFIVVLIVAGTLVAGLIVGAQRDDESGPVDLIVTNGRVYTGSASSFAEAVAIRGNTILRVGTNREIKRLRRPQTALLDAAVPDRPAYLVAYDGHTGWANTRALEAAGITRRTPSPTNGVIVRDPRTGEPTGVLKEAAQSLMQKV